jgi:hypothetical protein
MILQGQVFKLKARSGDGEPLWAYRYRVAGRSSAMLPIGGLGVGLRNRGRFSTG